MSREVNLNNLTYCFKGPNFAPINFISFRGPLNIYEEIKNGNISVKKAEEDQNKFKSNLSEITSGNPKYRKNISQIQKKILEIFIDQKVINLFNDYSKIRSEPIYKTKQGTLHYQTC